MGNRLSARGLAIALSIAAVLLISPTPVPRHVVETWLAARSEARTGNTQSAAKALRDLQLLSAWLPALKSDAVRLALAGQDAERALAMLQAAPAPQAPRATIACWRAEALALLGQWEQAIEALSSANAADCMNLLPLLRSLAARNLESGELTTATSILQSVASLYPQDAQTISLLGACLVLEDPSSSLATIQLAASMADPLAIDLDAVLRDLLPADPSARLAASGEVLLRHSLWPLAAEAFRQLVDLDPTNASAHAYYGLSLDEQGLDGLTEIETAARLDPGSAMVQLLLGLHWQQQGQPQKAISHLKSAVELEPKNSAYRASLAAARAETGDIQAAAAEYRQAAELHPTDPAFWRLLAAFSIAQELDLASTGLPAARNAVVLDPEDTSALELAGHAHFLLGDSVTAERLLSRSLALDPTSASARLHYGLLLVSAGRTGEARAQLAAAARLGGASPTGQFAQRALAALGE